MDEHLVRGEAMNLPEPDGGYMVVHVSQSTGRMSS